MKISMYSVVSSVIVSSVFISVLCIWRKRYNFRKLSDVRFAGIAYLLCILRLFLPIDFSFTRGVRCEGMFSDIWKFLFTERLRLFHMELSIADTIGVIAIFGGVIKLLWFLVLYKMETDRMRDLPEWISPQKNRVMERIADSHGTMQKNCRICCSGTVHMPFTIGIFRSRIILPAIKFSDQELYFILLHELTHIRRYDLLKKFFLQILFCVLWWVPYHSTAVKDLEQIMEIRCDKSVTNTFSAERTSSYMTTILRCLGRVSHDEKNHSALAFALTENQKAMKERFVLMASDEKRKRMMFLAVSLAILCIVGTYLFVPFPYYTNGLDKFRIASEAYLIWQDGSYYIINPEQNIRHKIPETHAKQLMESGIIVKGETK